MVLTKGNLLHSKLSVLNLNRLVYSTVFHGKCALAFLVAAPHEQLSIYRLHCCMHAAAVDLTDAHTDPVE